MTGPVEANLRRDAVATIAIAHRALARAVRAIDRGWRAESAATRTVAVAGRLRVADLMRAVAEMPPRPVLPDVAFSASDPAWVSLAKANMAMRIWSARVVAEVRAFEAWMDHHLPGPAAGE